ncbi:predicted protein [Micromonas commoda]|uniref:RNA helicase n=1 Tax=Micromonas commoda (strain RCC299 / NOUM17 / CCMP2709) TaxID=296587 RepID=C1EHH3_MICCC|nr:predicted protein [Micromonas commoda]ACO67507.1 predicted protein [Micromonas commoda]|eukprot:XP_002506249.1 predicted protein [Micromonas commoda]
MNLQSPSPRRMRGQSFSRSPAAATASTARAPARTSSPSRLTCRRRRSTSRRISRGSSAGPRTYPRRRRRRMAAGPGCRGARRASWSSAARGRRRRRDPGAGRRPCPRRRRRRRSRSSRPSSKRRRTDDPAPTPATTAEIQPARDDDSSQPRDRKEDAPAAEKGKDPAADLAAQMRERRERAAAAAAPAPAPAPGAADDDDAPGVSDRRPPGWTLDADEDLAGMADEDDDDDETPRPAANKPGTDEDEEDVDPLEAFMAANDSKPANVGLARPPVKRDDGGVKGGRAVKKIGLVRRFFDADSDGGDSSESGGGADSDTDGAGSDDDAEWARKQQSRMSKADKLGVADHDSIDYPPFRKNFYIESYEIARMTKAEVKELRAELEGIRCRGKDVPRPIKTWAQAGLSNRVMELIRRSGFDKPMPIQCQALPVIMSGRDCIGVAKTGSGKTLSYVLPMLRHVKDQRPIESGDGPIGMIMGPTRELVTQIGKDCKKFGRAAGLVAVSVYGGSGVATQIGELKRGCEIVACTPGRMIDVLTTGAGRITNLRRVTYMVLDEADRMFDMGFEPQITRIMNNLRPDRQTVMFSATFPHAMEALARSALTNPVEIQVGGRSVVNSDIEQIVEMRAEEDRFLRVLELLGEWYERGKIIIFVASQDKCDQVFRDLLRSGYPCLSLHGGKEQSDRECTIADFKSDVCNILVATSVAARGLDVSGLRLVVNYDTPNHLEDYVHRVGRTGRAGNKGTAVTFISQEEEKFAPDLVKAMTDAKQPVPSDLRLMADEYAKKKKEGLVVGGKSSGFGGSGFKFSREEQDAERRAKKAAALAAGLEVQADDESDSDDEGRFDDDGEPIFQSVGRSGAAAAAAATTAAQAAAAEQVALLNAAARAAAAKIGSSLGVTPTAAQGPTQAQVNAANNSQMSLAISQAANSMALVTGATTGAARAAAFAAALNAQHAAARSGVFQADGAHFESELEINDFPQQARWKVTHKDTLAQISEFTGSAITVKGQYYAPNKPVPPGERKLFLLIEGPSERCIKTAKGKIKEIIEEIIAKESLPGGFNTGKYKV